MTVNLMFAGIHEASDLWYRCRGEDYLSGCVVYLSGDWTTFTPSIHAICYWRTVPTVATEINIRSPQYMCDAIPTSRHCKYLYLPHTCL